MDIGIYQSAASLNALERWQDAVAQNITSGQVTGYRKRTVEFSGVAAGNWAVDSASNDSGTPAIYPTASNGVSYTPGEMQPTQQDLDVAVQGEGFFEVQMPDGTHAYTRSGEFKMRADHALVNTANEQVLNDAGSPVMLQGDGSKVVINSDGSIMQGGTNLGRLSVQKFSNFTDLIPISGGQFVAKQGVEPEPVAKPAVLQGYLESSNAVPLTEMVNLVQISRAYDANQHVITAADKDMDKEIQELG